jgi:hypothetical protein
MKFGRYAPQSIAFCAIAARRQPTPEFVLAFFLGLAKAGLVRQKAQSAEKITQQSFVARRCNNPRQPSKCLISQGHLPDRMAVKMHDTA